MIAEADRAYTPTKAAERIGVSRSKMYNYIKAGRIKTIRYPDTPGRQFVTSKELALFLKKCLPAA